MEIKRTPDKFVANRERVEFTNQKGENVLVILSRSHSEKKNKYNLMNQWIKCGYTKKFIADRITVETYATNEKNECYGHYNPTHKLSDDGKRMVINFEWVLEDTEENRQKIIDEVIRLANADE